MVMTANAPQQGPAAQGPRPAPAGPRKRRVSGCVIALVIVSALIVCVSGLLLLLGLAASGAAGDFGGEGLYRFRQVTIRSGGPKKVVVIPVEGVITMQGPYGGGTDPVELYKRRLQRAAKDDSVAAVILSINSPGGGITATDIMHKATVDFRKKTGRPVVGCMMDVAASGGYYLAAACDHVVAHPTSLTGSIGVMMPLYDVTGLMSKIGVKTRFVTSGPFKLMGSPFVDRGEEQEAADRKILQDMVDRMYSRFVQVVADGRKMDVEKVRELADGRIFTGEQAKAEGLVDAVGYFEDAVRAAEKLSGATATRIVTDRHQVTFLELLSGQARARAEPAARLRRLLSDGLGRPLYLWLAPGTSLEGLSPPVVQPEP
jgi:protease-4